MTAISSVKAQIEAGQVNDESSGENALLAYRWARRPKTGTATAPVSSVAVSSHSVDVAEVCIFKASCGSTGTSRDIGRETVRPAAATSASVAVAFAAGGCPAVLPGPAMPGDSTAAVLAISMSAAACVIGTVPGRPESGTASGKGDSSCVAAGQASAGRLRWTS